MQKEEYWKDVINHEESYQISNFGRFKFKERIVSKGKRGERLLKERITYGYLCGKANNDYNKVTLSKNSMEKLVPIHRLVAIHFIPNPENKPQVNHIDSNRFNNHVDNLEWVTSMENNCHYRKNSYCKSKYPGITFVKKSKKWQARITVNKQRISLGFFDCEEKAHNARVIYEKNNNINNKYSSI